MGEVYLAHDEVLDRNVALKVLRKRYAGDEGSAERFRREASSAASLSHPNIVQVYNRGETGDGTLYIVMEYVSGGTLQEQIEERGPLEAREAAAVAVQIAEALVAAHERGVIHRDIKPQNVLLDSSGDLKVTDFGIARAVASSSASSSASSAVFGTAGYISPEQAIGEPVGPASDLYSLGVVLYEMLTGELPYTADNPIAVCMKHVTEPLRPPRELNPAIPEEMDALVVKLLAKDPAGRYGSAAELVADLERLRDDFPPAFGAESTTQPLRKGSRTAPRKVAGTQRERASRILAFAAVAMLALLGTLLPDLLQGGAGQEGALPRAEDVAGGLLGPPRAAHARTAETGAEPALEASPASSSAASASPAAPTIPPPASSSAASASPAAPTIPPPDDDRTPTQSQYGGGGD